MEKYKKVLIASGSGFAGTNLSNEKPRWIYPDSSQLNLLNYKQTKELLVQYLRCLKCQINSKKYLNW